MIFARKMSEFSIKIARKFFSRILGARAPTAPLPPPRLLRLWSLLALFSPILVFITFFQLQKNNLLPQGLEFMKN